MAKRKKYPNYGIIGIIVVVILISLVLIVWGNSVNKKGLQKTGLALSQPRQDCVASSTRPCYDKQTENKIVGLESKGGEKAFAACLKTNTFLGSSGSLITATSKCGREKFLYCYEGKSEIFLRKFVGCELPTIPEPSLKCPKEKEFYPLSFLDTSWSMSSPTNSYWLRSIFKSKTGTLFAAGFTVDYSTENNWGGAIPVMHKSTDNGRSWTSIKLPYGDETARTFLTVLTMAEDRNGILYAGGNRLWKSTDGGNTWSVLTLPYTSNYWGGTLPITYMMVAKDNSLIAIFQDAFSTAKPSDPYYVRPGVFRSINGGNTWNEIFTHTYFISSIVDANDDSLVFRDLVGGNPGSVYLYANGIVTKTFTDGPAAIDFNTGLLKASDGSIYFISVDEDKFFDSNDYTQPGAAYLSAYKSTNNGRTWTELGSLPNSWELQGPIVEGSDGTLYTTSWSTCYGAETVYKSEDRGASWTIVANAPVFGKGNKADPYFRFEISDIEEASGRVLIAGNAPVIFSTS